MYSFLIINIKKMTIYIWNQTANIINNNIDKMEEYLVKNLTELITKYVELEWDMQFVTWFINSRWQYVTLQEKSDSTWIDYSIRSTMLDSEYWEETEIDWWEIVFQLNDNYYWIDSDELEMYQQDYINLLKNKDDFIKYKVDYIISLTW